jgi:hypothetical protein
MRKPSFAEQGVVGGHEAGLAHGGGHLQISHRSGAALHAQGLHAAADGAGGDHHHLAPLPAQGRHLAHQFPHAAGVGASVALHQHTAADFDHDAAGGGELASTCWMLSMDASRGERIHIPRGGQMRVTPSLACPIHVPNARRTKPYLFVYQDLAEVSDEVYVAGWAVKSVVYGLHGRPSACWACIPYETGVVVRTFQPFAAQVDVMRSGSPLRMERTHKDGLFEMVLPQTGGVRLPPAYDGF